MRFPTRGEQGKDDGAKESWKGQGSLENEGVYVCSDEECAAYCQGTTV